MVIIPEDEPLMDVDPISVVYSENSQSHGRGCGRGGGCDHGRDHGHDCGCGRQNCSLRDQRNFHDGEGAQNNETRMVIIREDEPLIDAVPISVVYSESSQTYGRGRGRGRSRGRNHSCGRGRGRGRQNRSLRNQNTNTIWDSHMFSNSMIDSTSAQAGHTHFISTEENAPIQPSSANNVEVEVVNLENDIEIDETDFQNQIAYINRYSGTDNGSK
ncbi:uncharacterized protein LOC112082780 [Eutrema salsugineum]|uniref:uncharacterized protein LOC112082780 n=1 Tax=Eutrema salsugineum TaxID=72664 RepID=UPI000CED42A0|nr:uncharacterized protein LOC112082780 [Eutrema salsugineum]